LYRVATGGETEICDWGGMYYLSQLYHTTLHCTPLNPPPHSLLNLDLSTEPLPYGYPEDFVSVALGAEMFDCVWATAPPIRQCHNLFRCPQPPVSESLSPVTSHAPAPSAFLWHSLLSYIPRIRSPKPRYPRWARNYWSADLLSCGEGDSRCAFTHDA